MSLPRPIIPPFGGAKSGPAPPVKNPDEMPRRIVFDEIQPVLPVRPDRAEVAEVFPESTPLKVDVNAIGNAPRLPAAEGEYRKRVYARTAKAKAKAKSNESVKRRDLIPGHEIYLMICQQVGGDPTAKKTITIDAGEERTAMKVRVNFYSWRQATIKELGPDFAADNHLRDIKVYLDPVLDEQGVIRRHQKSHFPISNGKVIFYSIRSMREMQALAQALPQLGVNP